MAEDKDVDQFASGRVLPEGEEDALRKQVRARLEAEYEKTHPKEPEREATGAGSTDAEIMAMIRAERLRVVRDEEDSYYAERGLYRYRNHRGEYEWLTKEERDERTAGRRKKSRRSRKSVWRRLAEGSRSDVINGLMVVVIIAVALLVFFRNGNAPAKYSMDIRSIPPGAAIFIDGDAQESSTNARISVEKPGTYTIQLMRPGFRTVPPSRVVNVSADSTHQIVVFDLYPLPHDSTDQSPSPSP